jgi:hypothetical protein
LRLTGYRCGADHHHDDDAAVVHVNVDHVNVVHDRPGEPADDNHDDLYCTDFHADELKRKRARSSVRVSSAR